MGLIGYPRKQDGEERCVARQKRLRARLATSAQHCDVMIRLNSFLYSNFLA